MGDDSVNVILTQLQHLNEKLEKLSQNHGECRSHCNSEMPVVHGRVTSLQERMQAVETRCQLVQGAKESRNRSMPHYIHTLILAASIIIGILLSVKVH